MRKKKETGMNQTYAVYHAVYDFTFPYFVIIRCMAGYMHFSIFKPPLKLSQCDFCGVILVSFPCGE